MKANKVLKILNVTRPTLVKYVKDGTIRTTTLPNGTYDYNDEGVCLKSSRTKERVSVIYPRVSTANQKAYLENQEKMLMEWCNTNGIKVAKSYKDMASGMNFDRKQFMAMFGEFGCRIVVINDMEDVKSNETEIFEEIISMLHCFAMKIYSNRRKKKLQLIKEDLKNEIGL